MTSLNKADPGNDTFAILDQLEDFRGSDGKLEFKMRWPDANNVWFQKSNPVTSDSVEGFEPVAVNYAQDFVGLAKNDQPGTTYQNTRGWWVGVLVGDDGSNDNLFFLSSLLSFLVIAFFVAFFFFFFFEVMIFYFFLVLTLGWALSCFALLACQTNRCWMVQTAACGFTPSGTTEPTHGTLKS